MTQRGRRATPHVYSVSLSLSSSWPQQCCRLSYGLCPNPCLRIRPLSSSRRTFCLSSLHSSAAALSCPRLACRVPKSVVVTKALDEVVALLCVFVPHILYLNSFFVQTACVAHNALYCTISWDGCRVLLCLLVVFYLIVTGGSTWCRWWRFGLANLLAASPSLAVKTAGALCDCCPNFAGAAGRWARCCGKSPFSLTVRAKREVLFAYNDCSYFRWVFAGTAGSPIALVELCYSFLRWSCHFTVSSLKLLLTQRDGPVRNLSRLWLVYWEFNGYE